MAGNDESRSRSRKALPVDSQGTIDVEPETPRTYPTADERIDDPIDAEVIEEEGPEAGSSTGPRSRSRAWREGIREKVRAHFGPEADEKRAERDRQRETDAQRLEWDDDELDEREHVLKLRSKIRTAGETYMQSIRDSGLAVPGYESTEQKSKQLSRKNQVYLQMMMQSCVTPLARGVRPTTIVQAAGMFMAMQMLSKDFRDQVGGYTGQLKEAIQKHSDKRITARVNRIERGIEDKESLFSDEPDPEKRARLVGSTDPRDYLTKRQRKRFDDLQHRERGHRAPFTPESAAMTEVALLEDAYWSMRDPSTDNTEVRRGYRAMRARLHHQMSEDGLERQDVVTRARMILGERMEQEPEVRTMVNGVAHGRIVLSAPHEEQIAGTDKVRRVWRGEVEDQNGRRLPDSGMFMLREPMAADAHQVAIAETMESSLLHGCAQSDSESLAQSMEGYLVGFAARKDGRDTRDLPDGLRARIDQSHVMLASMEMDGLDDDEQRRVYSNAFVDAMQSMREKNPKLDRFLAAHLGEDWKDRMQAAVEDPDAFFAAQAQREESLRTAYTAYREGSRVYQQGPGAGPAETSYPTDEYQPA